MSNLFLPNDTSAPVNAANFEAQAEPDSVDFAILVSAMSGTLVRDSGGSTDLQLTSTGTLGIQVNKGTYLIGGVIYSLATAWTSTISSGDGSNPRFDLVVIDSTQTPSVVAGSPNANPCLPVPSQDSNNVLTQLVVGAIWVPTGASSITSSNVLNKRIFIGATQFGNYVGAVMNTRLTAR